MIFKGPQSINNSFFKRNTLEKLGPYLQHTYLNHNLISVTKINFKTTHINVRPGIRLLEKSVCTGVAFN